MLFTCEVYPFSFGFVSKRLFQFSAVLLDAIDLTKVWFYMGMLNKSCYIEVHIMFFFFRLGGMLINVSLS